MTISELIEALEKIKEKEGDIEVRIQFRDDGGDYCGTDEPYGPYADDVEIECGEFIRCVIL